MPTTLGTRQTTVFGGAGGGGGGGGGRGGGAVVVAVQVMSAVQTNGGGATKWAVPCAPCTVWKTPETVVPCGDEPEKLCGAVLEIGNGPLNVRKLKMQLLPRTFVHLIWLTEAPSGETEKSTAPTVFGAGAE